MADSYHIIDGKVVPYSGGRKCNDTDAWRDATPLELQLQEQLEEYEHAIAAKDAEIDALRTRLEDTVRDSTNKIEALRAEAEQHFQQAMSNGAKARAAQAQADNLRTEVEALRAEVERLRADRDSWEQQAADRLADWHAEHLRAERLAEALRHQRWCRTCAEDGWESCEDGRKADALLHPTAAQENDDA